MLTIIISGIVLVYGYWHSITHGSAHIDLFMKSSDKEKQITLSMAEVLFMDPGGIVLARGISDEKNNYIHLIHPKVGDCHDLIKEVSHSESRKLWQECFRKQSTWIMTWIREVRQVEVRHRSCPSIHIPIVISEHNSEWPLWWIPLPHVGGLPYSYFRARIVIDDKYCNK